jgi:uncharacterized UPF0160 family protein
MDTRNLCVHDGVFHADEVTAAALLLFFGLIDREGIIRSRNPATIARSYYVCDVGGIYDPKRRRFDHHQSDYKGELSSAGMILAYLKETSILDDQFYHYLNNALILGVDAHDNGRLPQIVGLCTFSHMIAAFNPVHHEASEQEQDKAFYQAVDLTISHLQHLQERFSYDLVCRKVVQEAMDRGRLYLEFEHSIPWFESFFALGGENHSALFIIMPTKEGYKLRGIPPNYIERMKVRLPLPQEWAGLLDDDLKRVSKIEGAMFCHKGRFTSVWKTKEDALKALKTVFDKNGVHYGKDDF